ncbi:EpsG family protein [Fusobacterium sp.]|uniref:EpsG family protein n=1 Tax=Fusobacterium sp. TaxID=68766 RepID=UPI00345C919C
MYYSINFFVIIELFLFYLCIKNKKNIFIIGIFLFAIYLGFRDFYITDTVNYIREYQTGHGGYFSEKGFKYLGKILYELKFSTRLYIITLSLLNMFLYFMGYKILYKEKDMRDLVIWIFIFNSTFLFGSINILRQSLAGGFLLISLSLLIKSDKSKLSLAYLILGISFHTTLVFFLPLWIALYFKIYKKMSLKIEIVIYILSFILGIISIKFLLNIPKVYRYFYEISTNKSFYLKYIILLLFYIFMKLKKRDLNIKKILFVLFYMIIILTFFLNFKLLPSRLIYYSNIFIPILLGDIYLRIKQKNIFLILIQVYHIFVLFYPATRKLLNI